MFSKLLIICMAVAITNAAPRNCYGTVTGLNPTGTRDGGVPDSQKIVTKDLLELKKRLSIYQHVADENCIQASVIAAIASRESHGGTSLYPTGGYGDHGRAWGIMQCDLYASGLPCKNCDWPSECHIQMMVSQLLVPYIKMVHKKLPSWTQDMALQGGVAAYNFGVGNVKTWDHLDNGTTQNDYSNDVIARAQYLYKLGWN